MKIYAVGIGSGSLQGITYEAENAIKNSNVVVGYNVYIDLIERYLDGKEVISTGMMGELERIEQAVEKAKEGNTVAVVSSGDVGVYGMASLVFEVLERDNLNIEVEVISGVTAACSGAALLGAPLTHDFAVISLSDLLTPWEKIAKRLDFASQSEFIICIYNPMSKQRHDYLSKACDILLKNLPAETLCGYARHIGREGQESKVITLGELKNAELDMFTTVFIGNASTKVINGRLVTPRGYYV